MKVLYEETFYKLVEGTLIEHGWPRSCILTKEGKKIWIPSGRIFKFCPDKQEKKEMKLPKSVSDYNTIEKRVFVHLLKDDQMPSWSITVPHPSQIDYEELRKDLSRKQPLIIIQVNNEWCAMIHSSVIEKASVLGPVFIGEIHKIRPDGLYLAKDKSPQDVVEWVKKVRKASWGKHKKPTTIKVSYPKC